jgi:hypothetical protein
MVTKRERTSLSVDFPRRAPERVPDFLGTSKINLEGEAAQPSAGMGALARRILSQCPERSGQLEEVEGLVLLEARERLLALALHLVADTN